MFDLRWLGRSVEEEFEYLTVLWEEIEHWQRDNPAILSGYRPQSNSYSSSFARYESLAQKPVDSK
jgi:hypothetical protein